MLDDLMELIELKRKQMNEPIMILIDTLRMIKIKKEM